MLKCKDIIGAELKDYFKAVLITLEDGRCAMVNLETRVVFVGVYLFEFDRCGKYFNTPFYDRKIIEEILKKPYRMRGHLDLIKDEEKEDVAKEKKELGYNY